MIGIWRGILAKENQGVVDETDRRLLRALQADGRITNQELARQCGLSPAASFDRVKRLRAAGFIRGYTAILDPDLLGRALMIFIEVLLDRTTDDVFAAFAEHVRDLPEVMECHMVAGGFDYLLKVRVADMAAYRAFLGDRLVLMPGVRVTRTYAVLEEVKLTTHLPI
ncbi:MAG: ArsR family transcriptional regulator [Sphingomonas sp. SCN 67-18]|uniref:Lrp/AsnC ligand binding domain-containing protein n=1 Tax=uncultured Sphingomonas sp. TaxID=158754 RepID=UPI00086E32BD|nr:MAG: ArsR family transcriptional regulator [Sphingomonas sp. SCN 67-18]